MEDSLTRVSAPVTVADVGALLEKRFPRELAADWGAVVEALGLHDLRVLVPDPGREGVGTGRFGNLSEPVRLGDVGATVAITLPVTHQSVRVAGDVDVTSDLRHHRAHDHVVDGGGVLIDVAHWASEWPWLPVAAEALRTDLSALGSTVGVNLSTIPTDPWTLHLGSTR